jgi:hypothetical protein
MPEVGRLHGGFALETFGQEQDERAAGFGFQAAAAFVEALEQFAPGRIPCGFSRAPEGFDPKRRMRLAVGGQFGGFKELMQHPGSQRVGGFYADFGQRRGARPQAVAQPLAQDRHGAFVAHEIDQIAEAARPPQPARQAAPFALQRAVFKLDRHARAAGRRRSKAIAAG